MEPTPASHMLSMFQPKRPLPTDDPLPPDDYRRLVGVLESVDGAPSLPVFRERLLRAVEAWFGYTTVAVLNGPTLPAAMTAGSGVHSGYTREFLDEYASRWIGSDPFLAPATWRLLSRRGVVTLDELPVGADAAHRAYVSGFLRPHGILTKAGMVVDGGPAGVLYVGAAIRTAPVVPARDVAVLRALRRHLAPYVSAQLARDGDARVVRARGRLTRREREVAELVALGLTNQQVADRLHVGVDTVKKHLTRVLAETGCASRTQLAARWRTSDPG